MRTIAKRTCSWAVVALALSCVGCSREVENAVRAELIDPQSAIFSEIETKDGVTCGIVNSKNRLGGYAGPRAFIYKDGDVHFQDTEEFNKIGYDACSAGALSVAVRATHDVILNDR